VTEPPASAVPKAADEERAEHEQLLDFLYLSPVGLVRFSAAGDIEMMNPKACQLFMPLTGGLDATNLFDVLAAHAPALREIVRGYVPARGSVCEGVRVRVHEGADPRRPEFLSIDVVKVDGARFMAVVQDITKAVKQEQLLFADRQRFDAMFMGMRDALICFLDTTGHIATWNTSGERLLGYSAAEVAGTSFASLAGPSASEDVDWQSLLARVRQSDSSEYEAWFTRKNGERFWGDGVVSALRDERGELMELSVVLRDMTERKHALERLVELATKDPLTGLANRRQFFEYADKELARWNRHGGAVSLLMLDGDRFKKVNDTFGHGGGDEVLKDLASVLRASLRAGDVAARYGGEEFVVLLPVTDAKSAFVVAERIRTTVASRPVAYDGQSIAYTVSIGVAEAVAPTNDVKALLAAADAALYAAKAAGRNNSVVSGSFR